MTQREHIECSLMCFIQILHLLPRPHYDCTWLQNILNDSHINPSSTKKCTGTALLEKNGATPDRLLQWDFSVA